VVVTAHPGGSLTGRVVGVTGLDGVVAAVRNGTVGAAAIDMPMGLLDDRPRPCDRDTRRILGPRRSTVFPTPLRPVLVASSYAEACEISRAASGKALPKQSYHLLARIRALDDLIRPDDQHRIIEAHPECAFARLEGEPLASKHIDEGLRQRRVALGALFGAEVEDLIAATPAPVVDLLDAAVLTLTARHVVAGTAVHLGGDLDSTGKRAQVVY
jgi:predicted RNase H-like nuclease